MSTILEIDFAQPPGFRPLSLDLRTPPTANAPVVVFLHGGGWLRGSRKVFTPGIGTAESFDRIVAAGFAVAACEYRLSGEALFPAQLDDVAAAVAWLHAHGAEHGIDASRLVLWGVSAGATLAALTGLGRDDEARWLGAPATDVPDAALRASPIAQVHAGSPPFHISHGTDDEHVPFGQSASFARALRAAGADVEFHPVDGGRHFWQGLDDTAPVFDRAIDFARRVTAR